MFFLPEKQSSPHHSIFAHTLLPQWFLCFLWGPPFFEHVFIHCGINLYKAIECALFEHLSDKRNKGVLKPPDGGWISNLTVIFVKFQLWVTLVFNAEMRPFQDLPSTCFHKASFLLCMSACVIIRVRAHVARQLATPLPSCWSPLFNAGSLLAWR